MPIKMTGGSEFLSTAAGAAGLTAFVFILTTSCNLRQKTQQLTGNCSTAALFCLRPPWHTKLVQSVRLRQRRSYPVWSEVLAFVSGFGATAERPPPRLPAPLIATLEKNSGRCDGILTK